MIPPTRIRLFFGTEYNVKHWKPNQKGNKRFPRMLSASAEDIGWERPVPRTFEYMGTQFTLSSLYTEQYVAAIEGWPGTVHTRWFDYYEVTCE